MKNRGKRTVSFSLCAMLLLILLAPLAARAQQSEPKVVRAGWFDSSFCYWDRFGRRCGIDYEYQHKISAYTGWTYEYVEDSWPNLLQMLKDGQIDLLSDVSFKPERAEFMSFPDLPMGAESYYIYIDARNTKLTAENLASFNGSRIGVNQGSVQEGFLREWAQKNGVSVEIVPLVGEEDESMDMVTRGEIDGFASIYSFSSAQKVIPICRIGSSEYFYAVNKNRPDLLADLNMALAGIQDEDPQFNQRLSEERLYNARTTAYLTPTQMDWLAEHGTIRIGYLEDCLPFCQTDAKTGELTGALKDYLAHAANNLRNTNIRFKATPFASTETALEAMKDGQIDCVFPVNMHSFDSDQMGIRLTNAAMKTEMNAVMAASQSSTLSRNSTITFAVNSGDLNIETYIKEQYPECDWIAFPDDQACVEAVASGKADCFLVSNYRMPDADDILHKYRLFSAPTGESMPFSFAVNRADRDLYFLLNKTVLMTRSEDMDSALASHMRDDWKTSLTQLLRDNWGYVVAAISAVFAVIVFLLLQRQKAWRIANEKQRLLDEAGKIAELKQTITSLMDNMPGMNFTKDAQTGVYLACNQAFADYAHRANPEEVIGRTDAEIFDEKTAKHFAEDDRMALSMDEPYIFFEDIPDAAGNRRQIKTTRLKYTDAAGRLCVLGISVDVTTDTVRIRRENVATKEDYEKARSNGIIFAHIAQALARGYEDLYYVNLDNEQFIEYRSDADGGSLIEVRRGWHFFEECQEEAARIVYPDDQETVIKALDRRALVDSLNRNDTFMLTYRLAGKDGPTYVMMSVTRMRDDDRYIIMGVTDVDEQMRQRNAVARAQEEQVAYSRLSALIGDFLCVYVVDPQTGRYREFTAHTESRRFSLPSEGEDFFADSLEQSHAMIYTEDQNRFASVMTRENVMADIERHGMFSLSYRLMIEGRPRYVQLRAVSLQEKEGTRLIFGVNDIENQVRQEEEYVRHLAQARIEANIDALTGVKNRHAYLMAEERLNAQAADNPGLEYAIVILDVNDLKKVNDIDGHKAGDQYLRNACKIICDTFKHSPVFRVGGDEFTVIVQGSDYACVAELVDRMRRHNAQAIKTGGIVIACGMARREKDAVVATVFERADHNMYENKSGLKAGNDA